MTIRHRAAWGATMAAIFGMALASAGCGKYSLSTLKAIKSFKDGNTAYQQKDWKKAITLYEDTVSHADAFDKYPQLSTAYFFLGNSYDQLYKPAKAGDATNDSYIQKAITNYRKAADTITDKAWKKSALEYLAAAYGSDKLNDAAKAEPIYKEIISVDPSEPTNYLALAKLYEDVGRYDDAEAQYAEAQKIKPNDPGVLAALASYYNRQGEFDKTIDALQRAAALEPNNPEGYHRVATFYWEKASKDYRLSAAQKRDYVLKGLDMEEKALRLNPEYQDALVYKNILLRLEANGEKDPKKQKELLDQADQIKNKVETAVKRKQTGKG